MIPKHLMESKLITDEQWEEYQRLKEENERLKENWNKLKEYIKENSFAFEDGYGYVIHDVKIVYLDDILEKMQELEKGDVNE